MSDSEFRGEKTWVERSWNVRKNNMDVIYELVTEIFCTYKKILQTSERHEQEQLLSINDECNLRLHVTFKF